MHELSITRLIAAPPERVWDVMVNRQEEWWCPKPWRAIITAQDRRPGGVCDMVMHGPDGEVMQHSGIYLAFEEGAALPSPMRSRAIWCPRALHDRHLVHRARRQRHALHRRPPLDRGGHAPASGDGLYPGWTACADQLAACAKQLNAAALRSS
jgi:hypothetical protein